MAKTFLKKIFMKRKSDVSFLIYGKILFSLIISKIINNFQNKKIKKNSCLIIFPPSLGLGDLIMLSKIIDIVTSSKKHDLVKLAHLPPYLQRHHFPISSVKLYKWNEIICFETFIFPSPSFLNLFISILLGKRKCKGYINKNHVNFITRNLYKIKFDDPYHFRLKPFKELYNSNESTSPFIWNKTDRINLKLQKTFLPISIFKDENNNRYSRYIVLSTYNFYKKFRPSKKNILNEIKIISKKYKSFSIIILGANKKKELDYNIHLENILKLNFTKIEIINLTGKLSIQNSLDIISQSNYYIGANNGLANIAQMLGVNCTLLFTGPENSKKRKFSKFSKFIDIK